MTNTKINMDNIHFTTSSYVQPGTPDQLCHAVEEAERYYERSHVGIVVYWDDAVSRYRVGYQSVYKAEESCIDVVWVPWKVE